MEWTREKRYLPYSKWDADTLLHLQAQAANSPYQMHYHFTSNFWVNQRSKWFFLL